MSRQCSAGGKILVNALGWNSLMSQLAQHPTIIEQFYPGLGVQLPQFIATLAALPNRVIGAHGTAPPDQAQKAWTLILAGVQR